MPIMSHAKWMSDTKRGIATPRSKELKDIDTALSTYETRGKTKPQLQALKTALDAWIASKGAGWRKSTRNTNGTVEDLQKQINGEMGGGVAPGAIAPVPLSVAQAKAALRPAPQTRAAGTTLTATGLVQAYVAAIKANVHVAWTSLSANQRATAMHAALASLFPSMNIPQPGLDLVGSLGGDAGQFDFVTWKMRVASSPFGGATQPSRADFVDAAKTIYHEGRHCEQWFHMARYAASGGMDASTIATKLAIPQNIASQAFNRKMDARDALFKETKAWYESEYDRSGREIALTALGLRQTGDANVMHDFRTRVHDRYANHLPEEKDAWDTEKLLDSAYTWP